MTPAPGSSPASSGARSSPAAPEPASSRSAHGPESSGARSSPAAPQPPSLHSAHGPESSRARSSPAASHDRLRLFVALELPAAARDALVAFRDAAADPEIWRPVTAEAVHLTLAFLGRRPATDVPAIDEVLYANAGPAPRLSLAGAVLLPPRRARVLCAALVDPDGTLADLQARVSDGLAAAGVYVPEKRPFRAHATVARLRPRARPPRSVEAIPEPLEFRGEALTLFVSRLHPHGARYEPLARHRLH